VKISKGGKKKKSFGRSPLNMKRKRSEGNNLTLDFMKLFFVFLVNWPSDSIAQPKFASY
jgi:hypothetical protein